MGVHNAVIIDDMYFDSDILSQRLLDMEVANVDARDHRLLVGMEGDIK